MWRKPRKEKEWSDESWRAKSKPGAGGFSEEEGDKSVIEEGNENLNQGNILLAPRTEAEEERAKDERGEVEGGKQKDERRKKWRAMGKERSRGEDRGRHRVEKKRNS